MSSSGTKDSELENADEHVDLLTFCSAAGAELLLSTRDRFKCKYVESYGEVVCEERDKDVFGSDADAEAESNSEGFLFSCEE